MYLLAGWDWQWKTLKASDSMSWVVAANAKVAEKWFAFIVVGEMSLPQRYPRAALDSDCLQVC